LTLQISASQVATTPVWSRDQRRKHLSGQEALRRGEITTHASPRLPTSISHFAPASSSFSFALRRLNTVFYTWLLRLGTAQTLHQGLTEPQSALSVLGVWRVCLSLWDTQPCGEFVENTLGVLISRWSVCAVSWVEPWQRCRCSRLWCSESGCPRKMSCIGP
jgi:hypothetical protein